MTAMLLESREYTAAALVIIILACCCIVCLAAYLCGRAGGGGGTAAPTRRPRTSAYSGVGMDGPDEVDEEDYGEEGDDSPRGGPAVRVVRVGTKPHPPTRVGGRGRR